MTSVDDNQPNSEDAPENVPVPLPPPSTDERGQLRQFIETLGLWRARREPSMDALSMAIDEVHQEAAWGRLSAQGLARLALPKLAATTRVWMPIAAAVVLVSALAWSFIPRSVNSTVPNALHGAWKTANIAYSDRQLWLAAGEVAFQDGPTVRDFSVHRVTEIAETAIKGDTVFYRIVYDVDGRAAEWPVALVTSGVKALQFVNQRDLIWTPAGGAAWPR